MATCRDSSDSWPDSITSTLEGRSKKLQRFVWLGFYETRVVSYPMKPFSTKPGDWREYRLPGAEVFVEVRMKDLPAYWGVKRELTTSSDLW
jgi:hypothetical protein